MPPHRRVAWSGGLAIAAVAAVVLGLLLMPEEPSPGLSPIALAAERTSELPGGRFSFKVEKIYESAHPARIRGGGWFNADREAVYEWADYYGEVSPAAPRDIRAVTIGRRSWKTSSVIAGYLPDGKTWQLDVEDREEYREDADTRITSSGNPHLQLELLRRVSTGTAKIGSETVRGVKTTHYRAELDAERYAALLKEKGATEHPGLLRRLVELQGGMGRIDAWIDGRGLLRRTAVVRPMEVGGGAGAVERQLTEFFGFGEVPVVQAPPRPQVFDSWAAGRALLREAIAGKGPGWMAGAGPRAMPIPKARFVRRANEICNRLEDRGKALSFRLGKLSAEAKTLQWRALQGSPEAARLFMPVMQRLAGEMSGLYTLAAEGMRDLGTLSPPPRDREMIDRWLRVQTAQLMQVARAADTIRSGSLTALDVGQPSGDPLGNYADRIAKRYGMKACAE